MTMNPDYAPPWRHHLRPARWSDRRWRLHNTAQWLRAATWWTIFYLTGGK